MTLLDEVRASVRDVAADDLLPTLRRDQGAVVDAVIDVAGVGDRSAVAAVGLVDGRELFVPLVHDGGWRRAGASDAVSMGVLDAPPPLRVETLNPLPALDPRRERGLAVDMTNDVRIVDDAVAVKWQLLRQPGPLIGQRVAAHLSSVGFTDMPEPFATVTWHGSLLVAYSRFLPGADDGWDWMLDDVRAMLVDAAPEPTWPSELGRLTARMHASAVRPSPVIRHPLARRSLQDLARHYRALLDTPLDEEMRTAIERWRGRFVDACDVLGRTHDAEVIPVHHDLHPGQFLRWRDGIAVCDFDGNPAFPVELQDLRGPTASDVAGVLRGFDHVAIAAVRRAGDPGSLDRARRWARGARDEALAAYREERGVPSLDRAVLGALESLSPLHEAVYAATYLPRWRYVPLAVLDGGW